jgi:antirestriction protein ArdC
MYSKTNEQTRRDPYQEVTDSIVAALEAGTKPWVRPWNPDAAGGPQAPLNPTTGKHYRGINVLIPGISPRAFATADPRWMTYQQAKESGWQVRKGEKSTTIFFYKPLDVDDAKDGVRTVSILKQYKVFHASQVDGIPAFIAPTFEEAPWQRPEAADLIIRNSGAVMRTGGGRAFYSPGSDHIQLPPESAVPLPRRNSVARSAGAFRRLPCGAYAFQPVGRPWHLEGHLRPSGQGRRQRICHDRFHRRARPPA